MQEVSGSIPLSSTKFSLSADITSCVPGGRILISDALSPLSKNGQADFLFIADMADEQPVEPQGSLMEHLPGLQQIVPIGCFFRVERVHAADGVFHFIKHHRKHFMIVFEEINRIGKLGIAAQKDREKMLILDMMMAMGVMDKLRAEGNQPRLKCAQRLCIIQGKKLLAPLRQCRRGFQQPLVDFHPELRLAVNGAGIEPLAEGFNRLRYQRCELPALFDVKRIG